MLLLLPSNLLTGCSLGRIHLPTRREVEATAEDEHGAPDPQDGLALLPTTSRPFVR